MGKFCPVTGILRCVVNRIRDQFSMRDAITSQLVGHNLPRLTLMPIEQALEKTFCGLAITPVLEIHINHFTILVNSAP